METSQRLIDAETTIWRKAEVVPTERFLTLASGIRVRVREAGDGPPVLFVHGAINDGTSWANLIGLLPDYRCIALDRPGCGQSEPVTGAAGRADLDAVKSYADSMIIEVLDALELASASVVATSYGGFFAFRAAAANPGRIERIVELSWSMGAPMDKVTLSLRAGAAPGMRQMMAKIPPTRGVIRMMLRQIGLKRALANGRFSDEMVEWFYLMLKDTDTMANELRSTPAIFTPIAGLNPEMLLTDEELARVDVPVLFLWGAEDPNGGESVARAFAARLPSAGLEMLDEAGHAPWIDESVRCAAGIREFLPAGHGS